MGFSCSAAEVLDESRLRAALKDEPWTDRDQKTFEGKQLSFFKKHAAPLVTSHQSLVTAHDSLVTSHY